LETPNPQDSDEAVPTERRRRPARYQQLGAAERYARGVGGRGPLRYLSHRLESAALIRALRQVQGRSVLDAPCGSGRIHATLSRRFSEVMSLDSSETMLSVHKPAGSQANLCCGDVFNLPFPTDCFDWVVCYRLFHHMQTREDRIALLKEMARVGRQGVLFTAWLDTPLNRRRGSRRRSLSRVEMEATVRDSGLSMEAVYFSLWPFQPKCVVSCAKVLPRA